MVKAPFVRSPYNYDRELASREAATDCSTGGPSLCQQHFSEESDINTIVRRFGLTGQLPENVKAPVYGDFLGISDYQTALNAVLAADDAFMQMPAEVRARFKNDAGAFVDFCSDPANREEMSKLGLLRPADPAPPAGVVSTPSGTVST